MRRQRSVKTCILTDARAHVQAALCVVGVVFYTDICSQVKLLDTLLLHFCVLVHLCVHGRS
jgi:hypothetical protein